MFNSYNCTTSLKDILILMAVLFTLIGGYILWDGVPKSKVELKWENAG